MPNPPREGKRRPRVIAAPGLLEQDHILARELDETDAEYEARCRLFHALLDNAQQD